MYVSRVCVHVRAPGGGRARGPGRYACFKPGRAGYGPRFARRRVPGICGAPLADLAPAALKRTLYMYACVCGCVWPLPLGAYA